MKRLDGGRRARRRPGAWLARMALVAGWLAALLAPRVAVADVALVAVAANFAEVMERLEADFERESPHAITLTGGSTGKLYAQISGGAPYDVLLAADQERPERLEAQGLAVRGTRFTYALGRLTLWSADPALIGAHGAATLRAAGFRRLAIANPDLAPYGMAARQTLERLELYQTLRERIVLGENVGQAFAMVATGNAELGLIARSAVQSPRNGVRGSRWDVPEALYDPVRQDAVLLMRAEDNSAARDLLAYLRRPEVRAVIREYGYGTE
ncbi:MAG: molybdate ABC transporter substrate-binding protein [Pseudomonadales bacterium]